MKNVYLLGVAVLMFAAFTMIPLHAGDMLQRVKYGYVDNQGVKIHYATLGEGPLLVMVHGFPDFWYTWRDQMAALSHDYQVVAIDLRGYNLSDRPKGVENYTMRHLIGDVAAVIGHFPQKKAILAGHDWGGGIAWQVATWRPELVERLIILSTPHPRGLFRELSGNPEQQKNSGYASEFQKEGAHLALTAEKLAEWVRDDTTRALYIEAFRRSDFEAMLNYYKASFPKVEGTGGSASAAPVTPPRNIHCPTLAIFGLQDKALLPAGWNDTWEWIDRDLTLVSLPDAGHFVQQDASEQVTRTIQNWLERTGDGALRQFNPGTLHADAPRETALLGQLAGIWDVRQTRLNRDGTWSAPTSAEWHWYYILNGHAIQDDYYKYSPDGETDSVAVPVGTNLRVYNAEEAQWHMTWIDSGNRRLAIFKAVNIDGNVVMTGTNATGREVRNTFSNITRERFEWAHQWTFDEGQTWVVVSKMICKRRL